MTRLLVADDNQQNRQLLETLLTRHGYDVTVAADGAEALEKARGDPPNMIISDILMPGMDGYALCRQWIRDETLKGIPFVFYTATCIDPKDEQLALDMGAARFIVKPQEQQAFLDIIQEVIEEHKVGQQTPSRTPVLEETVYLKEYNEALIRKVEDKLAELRSAKVFLEREVAERKQAEEALRHSERQYRELVQRASSAILRWKRDGTITYFNEYAQSFFGYTADEVLGKHVGILVPERESTGRDLSTLIQDITNYPDRYFKNIDENVCRDGRRVWLAWTNTPLTDEKGQVTGILAVGSDITEHKQADDALRESEAEIQCILDTSIDGILAVAADGRVIRINGRFAEMWHIPQAIRDLKGDQAMLDGILDQLLDPEAFLQKVQELCRSSENHMDTVVFKDGRIFERYSSPLVMADSTVGRVWFFRDITERKRAEEALEQSERKFKTIFDNASDGMFLVDLETKKFLMCNAACLESLGFTHEEFINLNIADLHPPEELRFILEQIEKFMKTGRGLRSDIRFRRKDGTIFFADLNPAFVSLTGRGSVLLVFRDITERKQAEEKIKNQLEELRRWHDVMLGREDRVQDLKREVNELCRRTGETARYPSQEAVPADPEMVEGQS